MFAATSTETRRCANENASNERRHRLHRQQLVSPPMMSRKNASCAVHTNRSVDVAKWCRYDITNGIDGEFRSGFLRKKMNQLLNEEEKMIIILHFNSRMSIYYFGYMSSPLLSLYVFNLGWYGFCRIHTKRVYIRFSVDSFCIGEEIVSGTDRITVFYL